MNRCEHCGKIIWPWQDDFDYTFMDIEKHLCAHCFCGYANYTAKIVSNQRNHFLSAILASDLCVKGLEPLECKKMEDDSHTKEEICIKCWCDSARKAVQND